MASSCTVDIGDERSIFVIAKCEFLAEILHPHIGVTLLFAGHYTSL
jgi:hypothetical protein